MKDYRLIKYLAKLTGAKPKRNKNILHCFFSFDDATLVSLFLFSKGEAEKVFFDLKDVYEVYGNKSVGYEKFIAAFTQKYSYFEVTEVGGDKYVMGAPATYKLEHVCSQALAQVTVMLNCLNEWFGRNAETFGEEDWRDLHRCYLDRQQKISLFGALGSVGAFAVGLTGIILLAIAGGAEGILALLGMSCFLIVPASIIGLIICLIRRKYYKVQLAKSLAAKKR